MRLTRHQCFDLIIAIEEKIDRMVQLNTEPSIKKARSLKLLRDQLNREQGMIERRSKADIK